MDAKADEFKKQLKKTMNPAKIRESLIDNEYLSDVKFVLGDDINREILNGHRIFLMSSSPIFHELFNKQSSDFINIKIKDISKPTLLEIMRFAYTENINLNVQNMFDVLNAAHKFDMKFLVEKTIEFICNKIDDRNVFKILEDTKKFDNLKVKLKCFDYISKNAKKCFKAAGFLDITHDLLKTILGTCNLDKTVGKAAAFRWAENQCKKNEKEVTIANQMDELDDMLVLLSLDETPDSKLDDDSDSDKSNISSVSKASKKQNHDRRDRDRRRGQGQGHSRPRSRSKGRRGNGQVVGVGNSGDNNNSARKFRFFELEGALLRKNFKFANLDFVTKKYSVFIKEIHFVYDLYTTDKEFEIRITNCVQNRRIDLYCERISIPSKLENGEFKKLVLPNKLQLFGGGRKIWIKIEFPNSEFRLTLDNHRESPLNNNDYLELHTNFDGNSYAQIIEKIVFT